MFWDLLFIAILVVLGVNGYNRGLIASWRGVVAMAAATLIAQQFYIEFAAWVSFRLKISAEPALVAGYLMLWLSVDTVLEIILAVAIQGARQRRPGALDRICGIAYGLAKSLVLILLPLLVTTVACKIPPAPIDKSGLVLPDFLTTNGSYLLPGFRTVAQAMLPIAGKFVVSDKAPSFKMPLKESADKQSLEKDLEDVLK